MKKRTLTFQQIYREGTSMLKEAGIREAALDAWYLLEFATGISKASYYGDPVSWLYRDPQEPDSIAAYYEGTGIHGLSLLCG